jgi:hypothetical protein
VDVIAGLPVDERARATRVVSDHPPERTLTDRGGVGAELETMLRGCSIEPVQTQAGLDPCTTAIRIQLQHPVHVLREVDDDRRGHGLAGEGGPTPAWQHRYPLLGGDPHDLLDILGVARQHHPQR